MLVVLPMPLPLRVPDAVGLNVTVTAQEPPAAMLVQLLVWLKSPVTATFETVAEVVPELVTVTVCAAAVEPTSVRAKDRPAGAAFSTGPGAVPVPVRLTVLVTPPALTVRLPVRVPAAVGANFTLTVHEPFAAIDDPQVLVWVKSPLTEIDETDAAELKLSALGVAVTPEAG